MTTLKRITPSPKPLPLPETPVLEKSLETFLPNDPKTRRLRGRVLKVLKEGCRVWTGDAYEEVGLRFRRQPVRTVFLLMFVEPPDKYGMRDCALGKKSLDYLQAQLKPFGLKIGAAVPPNNYD